MYALLNAVYCMLFTFLYAGSLQHSSLLEIIFILAEFQFFYSSFNYSRSAEGHLSNSEEVKEFR